MALSCPFTLHRSQDGSVWENSRQYPPHRQPREEFERIAYVYPNLSSTGCTAKFCQAGRMKHTDEERVGRNIPIEAIEQDAVDFLYQLRRQGIIKSEHTMNQRVREVLNEIRTTSVYAKYNICSGEGSDNVQTAAFGLVGGTWTQSDEELLWGIRLAWKHARRCIMRSDLCDLRHIKGSAEMAAQLIKNLKLAFNNGEIRPTVFVFPPRNVNERGPMIWNGQLLSFAGYKEADGSILGDPMNVDLTKAVIELGWKPPAMRTKWDLLPLVTMAQGDVPVLTEIPIDDFPLVHIRHPKNELAFAKLGLRWVPAPALSRLGFTIGGVQYTASPFIGWFMDAEIGVRDLVDPFRYNVLPDIIQKMGLYSGDLDSLPDFERLALMSRAQLELNYAVCCSFNKAKVRMVDSLSASEVFSRFDDAHAAEHGFRLPSDPYWLAPPQGSVVPLWHRGAAPNYQPKPMICHHVQDPIKAWQRELGSGSRLVGQSKKRTKRMPVSSSSSRRRVCLAFCSSGTVARKLSKKLHASLEEAAVQNPSIGNILPVLTLDEVGRLRLEPHDFLVLVLSNTREGEMPLNGRGFLEALQKGISLVPCPYAIFGNGSMDYASTFNQTARDIATLLRDQGYHPVTPAILADTCRENPPWQALDRFYAQMLVELAGLSYVSQITDAPAWFPARICETARGIGYSSMRRVSLDLDDRPYPPMCGLSILPPNNAVEVQGILAHLGLLSEELLTLEEGLVVTANDFFRYYADLQQPFNALRTHWAAEMGAMLSLGAEFFTRCRADLSLRRFPANWRSWASLAEVCQAIRRLQPRRYSSASHCTVTVDDNENSNGRGKSTVQIDLLVQRRTGGRFSDVFLNSQDGTELTVLCKITSKHKSRGLAYLPNENIKQPLILFATGSGIGPVRCLLQHRTARVRAAATANGSSGRAAVVQPCISVFIGFKTEDAGLIEETLAESQAVGLLDVVRLTPSNPAKQRAQDRVFDNNTDEREVNAHNVGQRLSEAIRTGGAFVFACASPAAEAGFAENLSALLGRNVRDAMGDRYLSETYQPAV
ncbi:nitric oxide synthase [Thozetella sp. PMI_491]|nr:nitric oxide synthase [Thozetella sp. PMI_491]